VERELSSPGSAMRDRFVAEVPHVQGTGSTGEDADASYRIPVFVDEHSSNADYFKWVTHDDVVKTGRKSLSV